MKKLLLSFFAITAFSATAQANDLMVASAMQRCTTNEECTLVTNSCSDNCGFVPVNKLNLPTLQGVYQTRCGKPMEANPQCNINPPISAACINSRCTIDYAYANHAGAKDYKAGAYPVPEAAVPSRVPAADAPKNDRNGFTAYNLPKADVKEDSLGQITTKVYVPPSAPISGGNYVPVGQAAPAVPTAPVPATTAPAATVAPYAPSAATYATPPTVITPAAPVTEAVPAGTTPIQPVPQPTATTTPKTIATPADPIPSSASDRIPEPRTPQLDPLVKGTSPDTGNTNVPIPPSDFKEKALVPPPGSTSLVAPEDPGAKPDANMVLQSPVPRGPDDAPMFKVKTKPNSSGTGTNQ